MATPRNREPTWAPADEAATVAPSDSVSLAALTRGLYIGHTGDVTVVMAKGQNTVLFENVPAGAVLPICVSQVKLTGTTATAIVALY